MILYRCFAWHEGARPTDPDGPLWFPRRFQGDGRHDNPEHFGCLYLADRAVSCIVEQLARFRTQPLSPALFRRRGLPLAVASLVVADDAELIDLDEPSVLSRERLRPSQVATRDRTITQPQARSLHDRRRGAAGLRWWSTYEASWVNVTIFERAAPALRVGEVTRLSVTHPDVVQASDFIGLDRR